MRGMLLGLALVMGAGAVRGDVLVPYDNSINSSGSLLLNTHNGYAQKFTTGNFGASPLAVKTISVALFISTNNTNVDWSHFRGQSVKDFRIRKL